MHLSSSWNHLMPGPRNVVFCQFAIGCTLPFIILATQTESIYLITTVLMLHLRIPMDFIGNMFPELVIDKINKFLQQAWELLSTSMYSHESNRKIKPDGELRLLSFEQIDRCYSQKAVFGNTLYVAKKYPLHIHTPLL